jgi:hypothetical protein
MKAIWSRRDCWRFRLSRIQQTRDEQQCHTTEHAHVGNVEDREFALVKKGNVDGADPVAPEHVHHKPSSQAIDGIAERSGGDHTEGNCLQAWHFWCSHQPDEDADSGQQSQHDQNWRGAREQAPGGPNVGGVNQREESRHDVNGLIPLVTAGDVGDRPGFERLVQPDPKGNDQQWQEFHGSSIR